MVNTSATIHDVNGKEIIIPGYENVGITLTVPPTSVSATQIPEMAEANEKASQTLKITEDEARDSLLRLVNMKMCWGSGAARKMSLEKIIATNAFHYILDTYTEKRSTSYTSIPFEIGHDIDGPECGTAPLPWEIECDYTCAFKDERHDIIVPHTDFVTTCYSCSGTGKNTCRSCNGQGRRICIACGGLGTYGLYDANGNYRTYPCIGCGGTGRVFCFSCSGTGMVTCTTCDGHRNIKQFIQLTVCFTNHLSEYIVEHTGLPSDLIKNVQGDVIFEQSHSRVSPIADFLEAEVNVQSPRFVEEHATTWKSERILQQRHRIRSVPVHECYFDFKEKSGRFWVFGQECEVYTKDYPHTCCCCRCSCAIL